MTDQQVWLEAVIKENNRKRFVTRVISVEEKELLGPGENYLSQVTKLVVRAVRGDGEIVTESFILKRLPAGALTREMVMREGFNFVEFTNYRDVLYSMELVLKEKKITDEPIWPKCITMRSYETILFEDLTARGYKMANRLKGLDLDHCILVARNLGMFHALGLVMKEKGVLANVVFGEHNLAKSPKEYVTWIESGYKKLLEDMENWGDEWQTALEKMKGKLQGFGDLTINLLRAPENGFIVLNHGDTWTNNLLFKYNVYTGKPIHMRFLDFQVSYFSTPAYDLTYFLTSSPNLDVRRHHKNDLVRTYYDSLLFNMSRLGVSETPPTFEYIDKEMKRLTYLRIHFMTTLVAMITRKPEDTLNVELILAEERKAAERGEAPDLDAWIVPEMDDYLRTIYQMTIEEAEGEGTL